MSKKSKKNPIREFQEDPNPPTPTAKKSFFKRSLPYLLFAGIVLLCSVFISSMERPNIKTLSAYPTTTELPAGMDEASVKRLTELGFGNTENVRTYQYVIQRKKWKKDFGLNFIGEAEMTKFLKDNFFIMGESTKYIGSIPPTAGITMMENYERVSDSLPKYPKAKSGTVTSVSTGVLSDSGAWALSVNANGVLLENGLVISHTQMEEFTKDWKWDEQIYIIAAASKFNRDGMKIEEGILKAEAPPDPIAVVKVQHGYVELANW